MVEYLRKLKVIFYTNTNKKTTTETFDLSDYEDIKELLKDVKELIKEIEEAKL